MGKFIKLSNGIEIPSIGFGTYQITDLNEAEKAVREALKMGYRHIDTAQYYQNEEAVGKGIATSGVDRKEIFVTTKIWVNNISYEGVMKSFAESLKKLGLEYVDLLLIHQPYNDTYGAWRAMQELLSSGKVRSIGVSNFSVEKAVDLKYFNEVGPQVDQIEINPFFQRRSMIKSLQENGIVVEAWAPFAEGKKNIFGNPVLNRIAKEHKKTISQIILRWLIEQDVVVLAKTTNLDHMKENLDIYSFELTEKDKKDISELDESTSVFFDHASPEIIKWFSSFNK